MLTDTTSARIAIVVMVCLCAGATRYASDRIADGEPRKIRNLLEKMFVGASASLPSYVIADYYFDDFIVILSILWIL